MNRTQSGTLLALLAYLAWGFFPLYFHRLAEVPALEMVMHRILWSMALILLILAARNQWAWLGRLNLRLVAIFAVSAILLSVNWLIYIWAVQQNQIVDASLGYFVQPLFTVLLGAIWLHERLRILQWLALTLATLGVAWLTWQAGHLPWIGLSLAVSFGLYGLIRKLAKLGTLEGLALETALLTPFALVFLAWAALNGQAIWPDANLQLWGWLLAAGPITAIPLLLFAAGARRISLTNLGILQYIVPTIQFLLGIWFFNEPMVLFQLVGFVLIWVALVVFALEGLWQHRLPETSASRELL